VVLGTEVPQVLGVDLDLCHLAFKMLWPRSSWRKKDFGVFESEFAVTYMNDFKLTTLLKCETGHCNGWGVGVTALWTSLLPHLNITSFVQSKLKLRTGLKASRLFGQTMPLTRHGTLYPFESKPPVSVVLGTLRYMTM
jgi:hypothetical protein